VLEVAEKSPEKLDGFIGSLVDFLSNRERERIAEEQRRKRWIRESTLAAIQDLQLNTA
jgi:hypothetical protein